MCTVGIVGVSRGKRFVSSLEAHPEMTVTALCDVVTDPLHRGRRG
jgi:hypothetical protein